MKSTPAERYAVLSSQIKFCADSFPGNSKGASLKRKLIHRHQAFNPHIKVAAIAPKFYELLDDQFLLDLGHTQHRWVRNLARLSVGAPLSEMRREIQAVMPMVLSRLIPLDAHTMSLAIAGPGRQPTGTEKGYAEGLQTFFWRTGFCHWDAQRFAHEPEILKLIRKGMSK